jgi:hypothetical protein
MEIDEDGTWSNLGEIGVDDILLAYRAAFATACRLQEDIAIMQDLAVIRLAEASEAPAHIIRFKPFSGKTSAERIH